MGQNALSEKKIKKKLLLSHEYSGCQMLLIKYECIFYSQINKCKITYKQRQEKSLLKKQIIFDFVKYLYIGKDESMILFNCL